MFKYRSELRAKTLYITPNTSVSCEAMGTMHMELKTQQIEFTHKEMKELSKKGRAGYQEMLKLVKKGDYSSIVRAQSKSIGVKQLLEAGGDRIAVYVVKTLDVDIEKRIGKALTDKLRKIGILESD